jgi:hypothetical protein
MSKRHFLDERRIAAIAARVSATTAGPWKAMLEGHDHSSGSSCIVAATGGIELDGATDADLEFIANARQDIPYLLAELHRIVSLLNSGDEGKAFEWAAHARSRASDRPTRRAHASGLRRAMQPGQLRVNPQRYKCDRQVPRSAPSQRG